MKKILVILMVAVSFTCTATTVRAAEPTNSTINAPVKAPATISNLTNINTATAKELEKLPGIGKKSADAIVAYRTEKGNFKTSKDLLKVKGVGKKTLEKIQNLITFE